MIKKCVATFETESLRFLGARLCAAHFFIAQIHKLELRYMKKTISDLWNGDIVSSIDCCKNNEQLNSFYEIMLQNMQKVCHCLNGEKADDFNKYVESLSDYYTKLTESAFEEGFSLATKLIIESLGNAKS